MARCVPALSIEELVKLSAIVDRATVRRVALERKRGQSWASIGKELGVTTSAAWQRFARSGSA